MTVGEFIRANKNRSVYEKTGIYIDVTVRNSKYWMLAYCRQEDGLKISKKIENMQIADWYIALDPRDINRIQIWIMVKDG